MSSSRHIQKDMDWFIENLWYQNKMLCLIYQKKKHDLTSIHDVILKSYIDNKIGL